MYVLNGIELMGLVANAGGKLSLYIGNSKCTVLEKSNLMALLVAAFIVLVIALVQWFLVMAVSCEVNSETDPITMKDVQGNEVDREEDAMSKHLEKQMKEYFSGNWNQK